MDEEKILDKIYKNWKRKRKRKDQTTNYFSVPAQERKDRYKSMTNVTENVRVLTSNIMKIE